MKVRKKRNPSVFLATFWNLSLKSGKFIVFLAALLVIFRQKRSKMIGLVVKVQSAIECDYIK